MKHLFVRYDGWIYEIFFILFLFELNHSSFAVSHLIVSLNWKFDHVEFMNSKLSNPPSNFYHWKLKMEEEKIHLVIETIVSAPDDPRLFGHLLKKLKSRGIPVAQEGDNVSIHLPSIRKKPPEGTFSLKYI